MQLGCTTNRFESGHGLGYVAIPPTARRMASIVVDAVAKLKSVSHLDSIELVTHVQALNISLSLQPQPVTDSSLLGVLRLLYASPSRTQREMAHELGMSLGTANYLLRALLSKGFVKIQNFHNSSKKRGYAYLLTPEGVAAKAELTRHFLARKIEEYDALRLEIERLRAENEGAVEDR